MSKRVLMFGAGLLLLLHCIVIETNAQGPLDVSGNINGANYRIVVPPVWNGTLLVYAHGYRDKADHPGETDNRNADIAPNAGLIAPLLQQGYALAGTSYRDNGWAVEEGVQDLKDLTVYFRDNIARPKRTVVWATSMGTVIAFKSMEHFNGIYDGALCACAVGAGATRSWDGAGDLMLAYQTVFGLPPSWGTVGDIRDDINFETEVQPKLIGEVSLTANFPKFEFLRLVSGTPGRGLTPPAPPAFYPNWIFIDMAFATEYRSELERRAGGPVVQNLNRNYNLTAGERSYLNSLGITNPVIDGWLNAMNGQRNIAAPPASRNYVEHNANYSGKIKNPVLTMHTQFDPLVTVSQEYEYAQTVNSAGRGNLLFQAYTNGNGHCSFTGPQLITAVNVINNWVTTGVKPTDAAFAGVPGMLPGFVPPPMNQP
jgi:hypothetical protein